MDRLVELQFANGSTFAWRSHLAHFKAIYTLLEDDSSNDPLPIKGISLDTFQALSNTILCNSAAPYEDVDGVIFSKKYQLRAIDFFDVDCQLPAVILAGIDAAYIMVQGQWITLPACPEYKSDKKVIPYVETDKLCFYNEDDHGWMYVKRDSPYDTVRYSDYYFNMSTLQWTPYDRQYDDTIIIYSLVSKFEFNFEKIPDGKPIEIDEDNYGPLIYYIDACIFFLGWNELDGRSRVEYNCCSSNDGPFLYCCYMDNCPPKQWCVSTIWNHQLHCIGGINCAYFEVPGNADDYSDEYEYVSDRIKSHCGDDVPTINAFILKYISVVDCFGLSRVLDTNIKHNKPIIRSAHVAKNNFIYIFGGYERSPYTYHFDDDAFDGKGDAVVTLRDPGTTNRAWCYDLELNEWTKLTNMPTRRAGATAIFVDHRRIMVVGGHIADPKDPSILTPVHAVEIFDTVYETWAKMPGDSPSPLYACGTTFTTSLSQINSILL